MVATSIESGGGHLHDPTISPSSLDFCRNLPKAELHCHLNGSVRDSTLEELATAKAQTLSLTTAQVHDLLRRKGERSLQDCFKLFQVIHEVTSEHDVITRITREVVEDMAADGVRYLELRTTPKDRPACRMSKSSYLEAVLAGLKEADGGGWGRLPSVRLLLSIDRREDEAAAMQTVQLAASHMGEGVVGLDISGTPFQGHFRTFVGPLRWARQHGLRSTVHTAEIGAEEETQAILDYGPERLGHCCCLTEPQWEHVLASPSPVELCLSSNLATNSVPAVAAHHFRRFVGCRAPVVLCTDDPGVFSTSLSREYAIAKDTFNLTDEDMIQLARQGFEAAFLDQHEIDQLLQSYFKKSDNGN